MATKTLGTILIVFVCILLFPIGIGILGGVFGIVMGVFGAVFGAFAGIIGGIFGAIFGVFGWLFEGLFWWDSDYSFFNFNLFTLTALVFLVVLLSRNKSKR